VLEGNVSVPASALPAKSFGVFLKRYRADGRHTGIVYRDADGRACLLHLAWHELLKFELANLAFFADGSGGWVTLPLPDERVDAIAEFCDLVAEANRSGRIPYAFNSPGSRFDPAAGTLQLGEGELGLTCSTFVVALLRSAGVNLVETAWPAREDDVAWQRTTVDRLRRHGAPAAHVAAIEREIGCARIRPEEVAAAAGSPSLPASFAHCTRFGPRLLKRLVPSAT